jgi:1-deoxy-D-xylulose-5-phosphate reductoisomerase
MIKNIAIMGSTGSIGRQALEVAKQNSGQFKVLALAANANDEI